jgi:hypothetical protein
MNAPMPPTDNPTKRVSVDPSTGHVNVQLLPEEVLAQLSADQLETATAKAHAHLLGLVVSAQARAAGATLTAPDDQPDAEDQEADEAAYAERIMALTKLELLELLDDRPGVEADYSPTWSKRRLAVLVSELQLGPRA